MKLTTYADKNPSIKKEIIPQSRKLSSHWKHKLQTRAKEQKIARGEEVYDTANIFIVSWDDPDYPKGERTTTKEFSTRESAYEYAKEIARTKNLNREGKTADSLDVRTGYNPVPEPSANVPISIQTPFGMYELSELDVWPERYDPTYFVKRQGEYQEPPKDKVRGL